MESINLSVAVRKAGGNSGKLRREGFIPAVLYGRGISSIPLQMNAKDFTKNLASGGANTIFTLTFEVEGKEDRHLAMVQDMQRSGLTKDITHVDFQRISLEEKIQAGIPIVTTGEAIGFKDGGVLQHHLREIEVECLPTQLPDHYAVDISALGTGDQLRARDLPQTEGVTILTDPDTLILSISTPAGEDEAAETDEARTEPELVGEGDKENKAK